MKFLKIQLKLMIIRNIIFIIFFREYCTIMIKTTDKCLHKRLQYIEKLTEGKPEKKSSKGKYKHEVIYLIHFNFL
jgi:hypothetical protein